MRSVLAVIASLATAAVLITASAPARADLCDDMGPSCDKCRVYYCACTNPPDLACGCLPSDTCSGLSCGSMYGYIYAYCDAKCCVPPTDSGVKSDGGYDAHVVDTGTVDSGYDATATDSGTLSETTVPIDSSVPDATDDLPIDIPNSKVCYVFVHGSEPLSGGPKAKGSPWNEYWGDESEYSKDGEGELIYSVLNAKRDFQVLPESMDHSGKRWAAVTYDGTWPYYWAALDVLQQLESIETGQTPTSLEYVMGDDKVKGYHQGVNHCNPGDYLITVGHSMGNLAMAFLLENYHPDDLNYAFLRSGGLNANAPFYHPNPGSPPKPSDWLDAVDHGAPENNLSPWKDVEVPWTTPARVDKATGDVIAPAPDGDSGRCFYPPAGDTAPHHFPFVSPTDGALGAGVCRGKDGTLSVEQIVERVAYHYSIAGPFRGSPGPDCLCHNGFPSTAPDLCKRAQGIVDSPVLAPLERWKGLGRCNPANESMQTSAPYLVQFMGSYVGRHIYLLGGSDPDYDGFLHFNPIDAVTNGRAEDSGFSLPGFSNGADDGYPHALNDTAVPIASAMACDFVDIWDTEAKMSLADVGAAAFKRGLCGSNDKVWPYWATNDAVFAINHTGSRQGKLRREAYATPESFWTNVPNPLRAGLDRYRAGDSLEFGYAGLPPFPSCFSKPPALQYNKAICSLSAPGEYVDLRKRFEGCSPMCVNTDTGATLIREHRTVGHVIGIEEHYAERRSRVF